MHNRYTFLMWEKHGWLSYLFTISRSCFSMGKLLWVDGFVHVYIFCDVRRQTTVSSCRICWPVSVVGVQCSRPLKNCPTHDSSRSIARIGHPFVDELAAVCGEIELLRVMHAIANTSRAIPHTRGKSNRRDDSPRSLIVGPDVDSIRDLFEYQNF